jgi:hypothetical protein
MEKIMKKSDGRKNTKESFAKMDENKKMENPIRVRWFKVMVKNLRK